MKTDRCEQQELGMEIPESNPPKATPSPKAKPDEGGAIGEVELERMDFAALRNECGDCEDENGVSLWTVLESLRGYGVKTVHLI